MYRGREVSALTFFSHAEFAAAVLLVVEIVLADYFKATLLKAALAPVVVPPDDTVCPVTSPPAGFVDLIEGLPSGGSQSRGDDPDTPLAGIFRRAQ